MFSFFVYYALPLAFTVFVACVLTTAVSGTVLLAFKLRETNQMLRHPYLEHRPFEQYPIAVRATILMDYFLRLAFPGRRFWVLEEANRLMAHIDPAEIPNRIKWPLIGLWGGCFVGLIAMVVMWALLFIKMNF